MPGRLLYTTPIYYLTAGPHLGHLYTSVLADVRTRWDRLRGLDALLSTGTDEHGQKVRRVARDKGVRERVWCDGMAQAYKALAHRGDVGYSKFIRTTDERHARTVNEVWDRLASRGQIYRGKHAGWYAVSDECFYPQDQTSLRQSQGGEERFALETGKTVEWVEEDNWMFKLSDQAPALLKWLEKPMTVVPKVRSREIRDHIVRGLTDLSISRPRSRLDWGIPVPGDPTQTIYVWLDALSNYLTAADFPIEDDIPPTVHFVGKDILKFHAVYWPAILMAAGLPPPEQIVAHAHWTMDRAKMSKSLGNVADPMEMMDRFGTDPVRYYLCRYGGMVDDADFSPEYLLGHYRKDLAGQWGNLASRVLTLYAKQSLTDLEPHEPNPDELVLVKELETLAARVDGAVRQYDFSGALNMIFDVIHLANKAWTAAEPWKAVESQRNLESHVFHALEALRISSLLLQPFMPTKSRELLDRLGVPTNCRDLKNASLASRWTNNAKTSFLLFPRL